MDKGHTAKEYIGKICPYCKTAFVEGDEIVQCSACEMPHHKDCWIENQGCTTFGCQGTIRGLDGQAYSQMMAEGAQKTAASAQSAAYQRPVYGQNGYAFAGQSQQTERPSFGAQPMAYGAAPGAGKLCPNCGAQNIGDSIFCAHCGARMPQAASAASGSAAASGQPAAGQAPQNPGAFAAGQMQAFAASSPAEPASAASGQPISAQTEPQQTAAAPGQTGQAAWSTAGGAAQSQAGAASEQAGASAAAQSPAGPAEKEQSAGAQPPAGQEPAVDARPLADSANAQPASAAQNPANVQVFAASSPAEPASAVSGQPISAQTEPQQTAAAPGQTGQAAWNTAGGAVQSQAGAASEQAGSYAQTQAQSADPAQRRCPACGAHNPANAAFCYACGKQLAQQAPSSQADGTFCQNCGTKNPANAAFCYGCGARLYRPAQQEQPGADAAHPYDAIKKQGSRTRSAVSGGQAQTNAQTEAGGPVCPKCGTKNAAQAVFCQECGARFSGAVDPTRPYDAIKKQGSKRTAGGASAAPYGAAGQGAGQTSAPAQRAAYGQSAYRPAGSAAAQSGGQPYGAAQPGGNAYGAGAPGSAQPGAAPQGQARPVYTPPLGTYRVPSYTIPQPRAAAPLTPEEFAEERRLFLGQNEVYYEKKFAQLQSGQLTWNWAACCLTSFWLIYRRMYLWGYLSLLGQIILAAILAYAWPVAPLLFCILFGMFGNNIYKSHVEKEMKLVQRLSKQNRLIEYADKGGVRLAHPIIAGTIIGVYLIALICSLYI